MPDIPLLSTRPTGKDESNNDFEVVEVEVEHQNKTFQPTFNRKSLDRNQLLAFLRSSPNVRPQIVGILSPVD